MSPTDRRDTSFSRRETQSFKTSKELKDRIVINCGGKRFEPYLSTLKNISDLPLAKITENKGKLDYDDETGEFFFDRHPAVFAQVLNYLQTGKLHCPRNVCGPLFEQELAYWGIDEQQMESCCWGNYTKHRDAQESLKALDFRPRYDEDEGRSRVRYADDPSLSWWQRHQPMVWEILDERYSSSTAKVFAWVSLAFIVVSILTICVWTVEVFRDNKKITKHNVTRNASLDGNKTGKSWEIIEEVIQGSDVPRHVLLIIDSVCTGWFTLEFLLRLTFCPSKLKFMIKLQNWVDLLVIVPLYLMLALERTFAIELLNTMRVVRIFRFFKLLYDLQILTKTVKASRQHLMILLFILMIPVIVFSSLVLFSEERWGTKKSKEDFKDVPKSMWWGIITMTTIGYGDMAPVSFIGKIIGGMASICGVIILSTSASVVGSTFSLYYNLAQAQLKIPTNRRKFDVECQSLPTLLACRTSQAESTVTSNNSDSGYQKSPNRMQICDRNSFEFTEGEKLQLNPNRVPCTCQCGTDTRSKTLKARDSLPKARELLKGRQSSQKRRDSGPMPRDTRSLSRDPRALTHDPRALSHDPRSLSHDPRALSHDPRVLSHDPRALSHDPRSLSHDPRSLSHDPRSLSHDPRSLSHDPRSLSHDPRSLSHDPRALSHDSRSLSHDPRALSHDSRLLPHDSGPAASRDVGSPPPPTSPRPQLSRKASIRRDSILV